MVIAGRALNKERAIKKRCKEQIPKMKQGKIRVITFHSKLFRILGAPIMIALTNACADWL